MGPRAAEVPIADPEATARAAIRLLSDEAAWRAAQKAGQERVERYYTLTSMFDQYRSIYQTALGTKGQGSE